MTPEKQSLRFLMDLIKAKELVNDLVPLLDELVANSIDENQYRAGQEDKLYSESNPSPYGVAVGVNARIRWKESSDEKDVYFSFEEVNPETKKTASGVLSEDIFLCCTLKEFILGFPTEPFELV